MTRTELIALMAASIYPHVSASGEKDAKRIAVEMAIELVEEIRNQL